MQNETIERIVDNSKWVEGSYACAARIVVSSYNGRRLGGDTDDGFHLGEARSLPERTAMEVEGDPLLTAKSRVHHLQSLRLFLQEDVAPDMGKALYELATHHAWIPAQGIEGADHLAVTAYDGNPSTFALLLEKRFVSATVEALQEDWAASPFTLKWTSHLGVLYQVELLNGNSVEGRDLLLAEYNEAARILIENWSLVEKLAIALREATDGNIGDDPVWASVMKLFGQRFAIPASEAAID